VQQFVGLTDVTDIRGGPDHLLHQTTLRVHSDVSFHTKMPLAALLGLVYLTVALPALILCRGRVRDDSRIHDRARFHQVRLLAQHHVDLGQYSTRYIGLSNK